MESDESPLQIQLPKPLTEIYSLSLYKDGKQKKCFWDNINNKKHNKVSSTRVLAAVYRDSDERGQLNYILLFLK
jgi:hypothetical protein